MTKDDPTQKPGSLGGQRRTSGADQVPGQESPVSPDPNDLALYRDIFASNEGALLLINARGKVIDINGKLEEITGYKRTELAGRSALSLVRLLTKKGPLMWLGNPLKRVDGAGESSHEVDAYTKTGQPITLKLRSRLLKKSGKVVGSLVAVTDESRRLPHEASNDSAEVYRSLVNHVGIGIFRTTPGITGRFLEVNPAMEQITGYSREQLLQMNVADLYVRPENRAETVSQVLSGVLTRAKEVLFKKKDGTVIVVRDKKVAVTSDDGHAIYLEGFLEDVTERKRAEEALKASELRLNEAQAAGKIGHWECDLATREIVWSDEMYELYERDRTLGPLSADEEAAHFSIEQVARLRELRRHVITSGEPAHYDLEARLPAGKTFFLSATMRAVKDKDGRTVRLFGTIQDITERKRAEQALAAERENFRNSVELSPFGIQIITFQGELIYANRTILEMWGYSTFEELKATPLEQRFTSDSVALIKEKNEQRRRGEIPAPHELTIVCKAGGTRHLEAHNKGVIWNGERCVQILYEDITERKRAEEALRESEQKYRDLVDNAPVGIVVTSLDGRVLEVNRALAQMHGYGSKEEFIKSDVADRFHDLEDRERWVALTRRTGKVEGYEIQTKRKDGSLFWTSVASIPRTTEAGEHQLITVSQDITERRRAEEALKQSEEKLRLMFQSVAEGIVVVDLNGVITEVNQRMVDMHGLASKEEMVGKSALEFVVPEDREKLGLAIKKTVEMGVLDKLETNALRADGQAFCVEVNAGVIRDNAGNPIGSVAALRDVTETRRMQQQLMAQDRLASIGELVSGVAHEINNPLTGVIGFSQLLLEKDVADDVREDLNIIVSQAQRAAHIVKNLLTFARKHTPVKQPSQVNSIIEDVLKLRAYEQKADNIEVVRRLAPDLPEIMADYFQMQQVFFNIIVNAEYFMLEAHKRGTLTITTEKVNGVIRISLADDGTGIPTENLTRIFDPFFTTKEVGKGTGMGLSICQGIVAEHGGTIRATSDLRKGATFIVELPIE